MPRVSILLPVYKPKKEYLIECIESILNQTFGDFELLILDDCPEDKLSEEIIRSYKDKRINYFRNERNLGISKTRNKLIEMANSEYLAVMDHDDVCLQKRLELEVDYLDKHPEIGVVSANSNFIINGFITNHPENDKDIKLSLMNNCFIEHPASMIRKSVLIENNIRYEEEFSPAEDYALWCRLIKFTNFHNLPDVLLNYRDHKDNTSHKKAKDIGNATLAIRAFVEIDNPALYREFTFKSTIVTKVKLFGIFPIIWIYKGFYTKKYLLLNIIPLLRIKKEFLKKH